MPGTNQFYAKGKELILDGKVDFNTDIIQVALVSSGYVPNVATDTLVSAIGTNRLSTDQTLTSVTIANGVLDAADVLFPTVASGATAKYVVMYKFYGVGDANNKLVAIFENITNFPVTTNNGDIAIQWDSGAYKILSL